MSKVAGMVLLTLSLCISVLAQGEVRLPGAWQGTRSERNPINGQNFTINFAFEFRSDGTYSEEARFGRLVILKLDGRYLLQRASNRADPMFTHVLALSPGKPQVEPARDELRLLQIADLPNIERTEQWVYWYNLSPAGALSLKDRNGGESWGLQRVP